MKIAAKDHANATIIYISGRLDSATVPEAESFIEGLMDEGKLYLAFDLTGLEFMSSRGFNLFVTLHKYFNANDGQIAMFGMHEFVNETMEIIGLEETFHHFEDQDAALAFITN